MCRLPGSVARVARDCGADDAAGIVAGREAADSPGPA